METTNTDPRDVMFKVTRKAQDASDEMMQDFKLLFCICVSALDSDDEIMRGIIQRTVNEYTEKWEASNE